ncbi:hypothetical protein BHM03_00002130 [Ensete ventricosum]|nr:hypothetical protein BHM03_00002130 [Ensete ventricosum]
MVNEKGGGYTNRLVVTCLRSGLNRPFRLLQKPERAPIRALRASSSGRLGLSHRLDFFDYLQVMGDRVGNIRWWDVTTGLSSSFNTHREGIRRIKFSPVVPGDNSRGRIAVLFYDNTFSIFDLVSMKVNP